jgi:hypothetical protein
MSVLVQLTKLTPQPKQVALSGIPSAGLKEKQTERKLEGEEAKRSEQKNTYLWKKPAAASDEGFAFQLEGWGQDLLKEESRVSFSA